MIMRAIAVFILIFTSVVANAENEKTIEELKSTAEKLKLEFKEGTIQKTYASIVVSFTKELLWRGCTLNQDQIDFVRRYLRDVEKLRGVFANGAGAGITEMGREILRGGGYAIMSPFQLLHILPGNPSRTGYSPFDAVRQTTPNRVFPQIDSLNERIRTLERWELACLQGRPIARPHRWNPDSGKAQMAREPREEIHGHF